MAETEQRFTLHARSRKVARIIGYPAGLGLLVAAVFGPFGDTSGDWFLLRPICGLVGLLILVWAWATDRRRRIEVTEQQVTVVNSFSRYDVAWHELSDIEFEKIKAQGGWTAYNRLAFIAPSKRIVAEAPAGDKSELMKVRDRILHARELSLNEPQSDPTQPLPQPQPLPVPPGGQQPPDGPPVRQQPQKAKRFGWLTLIITAVVALGLGGIIGGSVDGTATTAEPNATATATVTAIETAQAEPTPTATKAPTTKNTTKPKSKSTMEEGTYEIGVDAKPGRYKTRVPEDSSGCYWEKAKDDSGEFDSLIANGEVNAGGRQSITLKRGQFFLSDDCGTWIRV